MKKEIEEFKKRLDSEILECMRGNLTGQRLDTIRAISACWMALDDRERRGEPAEGQEGAALSAAEAHTWADKMKNADGTTGAHWTLAQTTPYMAPRGVTAPPETFWCVMNMMYSDYYKVAWTNNVDTPDFYADMAAAFLMDADAMPNKAGRYYHCIVCG